MAHWDYRPEPKVPRWCDPACPMLDKHRCVADGGDLDDMTKCPEMRVIIKREEQK